jgi:peptidoglycan/LPS O-acetylase OafA/YrhL
MTNDVAPSPGTPINSAYPEGFPALSSLSFVALSWVVLNQFRDHLGLHAGTLSGIVAKGYLGAQLFFVVSGFLLCHVYSTHSEQGRFNHGSFVWNRVARTYPLHLAMIGVMAAIYLLGRVSGSRFDDQPFDFMALPANLALIHAWGVLPTVSWNFPSWLISADFFALLIFPLTARLALPGLRPLVLAVAAPVALFVVMFQIAAARGVLFTDMTAQIGALQTIPAYVWGAALYRLHRTGLIRPTLATIAAVVAGLWVIVSASWRLSDLAIWPAFGLLILGLAGRRDHERAPPGSAFSKMAGHVALSVYLVYLPVDILYFHAAARVFGTPTGAYAWAIWAGVFPVILATGAFAYWTIERPTWRWLSAHDPFRPTG